MHGRCGVLLINLGTPDAPEPGAVRRYLREFLSDPRVLDIPALSRWLLLHLVILPTRPARSAEAYRKVWTPEGSPLLVESQALLRGVRARFDPERVVVELAMRYGSPSIPTGLARLREAGCDHLIVFPLYPQYASSSTGSTVEAVYRAVASDWNTPFVSVVPPFYEHPRFLDAFAAVGRATLTDLAPDHVLFSFHGLPERQVRKSGAPGFCLTEDCCASIRPENRNCYRAQCFATARGLAERLDLAPTDYTISFQSRLGRDPWISPYTDLVVPELARGGKRRLAVFCPAFVADCLETLEEIAMQAKEAFIAAGGEALALVPSLNAHPAWVDAVAAMIADTAGSLAPALPEPATTRESAVI